MQHYLLVIDSAGHRNSIVLVQQRDMRSAVLHVGLNAVICSIVLRIVEGLLIINNPGQSSGESRAGQIRQKLIGNQRKTFHYHFLHMKATKTARCAMCVCEKKKRDRERV